MSEERKLILQMLQEGTISVEDADRLLEAISTKTPGAGDTEEPSAGRCHVVPKWVSIKVTEQGKPRVNVRLPFPLVQMGLRLGKTFGGMGIWYAGGIMGEQDRLWREELQKINIDELSAAIREGELTLPHTLVDAEDESGHHILITVE